VLLTYTGAAVSGVTYTLTFNRYPLPTGFDSFEGDLEFPPGDGWDRVSIPREMNAR
jgi:hypothetical protein